jgi:hypothetical protein
VVFRMDFRDASCLCIWCHHALALEHVEATKAVKKNTDEYYRDALRGNG